MKLYYAPGACSLASHIALHESGLPFEIDKLNVPTKTTSSGEDFMQINPKGYVPAIKLDDGSILTEGAVILQYIADQNPNSGLAPKQGTMERYRLQEWLNYIGTEIHKAFGPLFNKATPEEVKINARNLLIKRLGYVEAQLANKPYLMGNSFTGWLQNGQDRIFILTVFLCISKFLLRGRRTICGLLGFRGR